MNLNADISSWICSHFEEHMDLLLSLAQIPAPSNSEEKRALFCKNWLEAAGARGVYIDGAMNVIWPVNVSEDKPVAVFAAHSDVVFPDTEPLPLRLEDGKILCPGIGDDTACAAALMTAARYIAEKGLSPVDCGLLIVIDAGEEGLGNLKGMRRLFDDYSGRIREFISFDGQECRCVSRAVGSMRYRICIDTEGGHSYGDFGRQNAIACLALLIDRLYAQSVPPIGKTTYNVGTVSGGTSVNTIAQHAEMLYEFRSDEAAALSIMQRQLDEALEECRDNGLRLSVEPVGRRPCSAPVDEAAMGEMISRADEATRRIYGRALSLESGSTDCNIPLSLGIPALCLGCYRGAGAHTREEYVETDSLLPGLNFVFDMLLRYF